MKKITGEKLMQCNNLTGEIFTLLTENMNNYVIPRTITFEWCSARRYGGVCIMNGSTDNATIRISNLYDWDANTVAHEILHAFLPCGEYHGDLFHQASKIVNDALELDVKDVMTTEQGRTLHYNDAYKWAVVNVATRLYPASISAAYKTRCKEVKYWQGDNANNEKAGRKNYIVVMPYKQAVEYVKTSRLAWDEKKATAAEKSVVIPTTKIDNNLVEKCFSDAQAKFKQAHKDELDKMAALKVVFTSYCKAPYDEQKIKQEVERFAATHDDMRLPADWLKHIPCNWECYYRYKMNDGTEIANVFLYHNKKEEG